MTRPRSVEDGLPFRVYERHGKEKYSIGFKAKSGIWLFRYSCQICNKREIQKLRKDATRRALAMSIDGDELETIGQLITAWFDWQKGIPDGSARKRAASTMKENEREARNLRDVFGEMAITDIKAHHVYKYQDRCEELGRGPKGDKEISLFGVILARAVRMGLIDVNPLSNFEKLPSQGSSRYVTDLELNHALDVGRTLGGASLIVALALKMAYLCVRRSVEVLDLQFNGIKDTGIEWTGGKVTSRDYTRQVVIEWSAELRSVVRECNSIERGEDAGPYVFGNMKGERYTKGGWKSNLGRLMTACEAQAKLSGMEFKKFSLQDLRPKGVSDKLTAQHTDVIDATLHTNPKMIQSIYDRRRVRTASPTK
jgi:hypothetical protein